MSTRDERNRQIAEQFLEKFKGRDYEGVIALLAPDCVYKAGVGAAERVVPYYGTFTGHQEVRRYYDTFKANAIRPECIIRNPDCDILTGHGKVVVLGRIAEQFVDRTPMHDTDFALLLEIDEATDKIKLVQMFVDTAAVLLAWLFHRRVAAPG